MTVKIDTIAPKVLFVATPTRQHKKSEPHKRLALKGLAQHWRVCPFSIFAALTLIEI